MPDFVSPTLWFIAVGGTGLLVTIFGTAWLLRKPNVPPYRPALFLAIGLGLSIFLSAAPATRSLTGVIVVGTVSIIAVLIGYPVAKYFITAMRSNS